MTAPIILFAFLGRRANVELQMPFIHRILAEHPEVVFHAWNLTHNPADDEYVRSLAGERITVRNDFHNTLDGWNNIYRHYAAESYRNSVFVKLDDDVVFLDHKRFGDFLDAVRANPTAVVTAQVINNGACTPITPGLHQEFTRMNIRLLDVHLCNPFARVSHEFMFTHWRDLISQPLQTVPTEDWLSINCIGYSWETNCFVAERVGQLSPEHIAGRDWESGMILGDEGAFNLLPRVIVRGFIAGHLTFGPQACSDEQLLTWREQYAAIARMHLGLGNLA